MVRGFNKFFFVCFCKYEHEKKSQKSFASQKLTLCMPSCAKFATDKKIQPFFVVFWSQAAHIICVVPEGENISPPQMMK